MVYLSLGTSWLGKLLPYKIGGMGIYNLVNCHVETFITILSPSGVYR